MTTPEEMVAFQQKDGARMRSASGKVNIDSRLVAFLYTLMRDEIAPGRLERILDNIEVAGNFPTVEYSNGWLALYAEDITDRLLKWVAPEEEDTE